MNLKLEAVDKRNPSLVRAATIAEVNEYRLRIHFDGWDDIYDDWFEADSLDLYPVGWCEKTSHPFETPLSKCSVSLKISAKSVFIKVDLVGIPMDEVFIMSYVAGQLLTIIDDQELVETLLKDQEVRFNVKR